MFESEHVDCVRDQKNKVNNGTVVNLVLLVGNRSCWLLMLYDSVVVTLVAGVAKQHDSHTAHSEYSIGRFLLHWFGSSA